MSRSRLFSRRGFTGGVAALTAAVAAQPFSAGAAGSAVPGGRYRPSAASSLLRQDAPDGPFELPPLTYEFNALEPYIDAMTMEIHHDRHHMAFINGLNTLNVDYPELGEMSPEEIVQNLDEIPDEIRAAVRNNAGGHVNHTMFWETMAPGGGGISLGRLSAAIKADLGGFNAMVQAVTAAGVSRFGSGWAWIVVNDGKLEVLSTPNQDNPLMDGMTPILGVDVWEHAYYLLYQNMRPAYLEAWWNTVNWGVVTARYDAATA